MTNTPYRLFILRCKIEFYVFHTFSVTYSTISCPSCPVLFNKSFYKWTNSRKMYYLCRRKAALGNLKASFHCARLHFSLHRQPMKVLREPRRRHLLRPRAVTIDDRRRSSIKTQKVALSGSWQSIKLSFTQLTQMGKLKNLKKLEKLKPYALWLNLQPKRLLALTSNDRREW